MRIAQFVRGFASVVLVGAVASVALAACSGGDDSRPEGERLGDQGDDICERICARLLECDTSGDYDICQNRCVPVAQQLNGYRADVVRSSLSCYENLDCRQLQSSDALPRCIADAAALVTPTDAAVRFCDRLGARVAECDGGPTPDRTPCLQSMKLHKDQTLNELTTCTEKGCGVVTECIEAVLDARS